MNRLAFLFFAEDVRLLPAGYFRRVLEEAIERPAETKELFDGLFAVLQRGDRFTASSPWARGTGCAARR